MDARRYPRFLSATPVIISGIDAEGRAFTQMATAKDISEGGARLYGVASVLNRGDALTVQCNQLKAEFIVVWVGERDSDYENEVGLQSLPGQLWIWDMEILTGSHSLMPK